MKMQAKLPATILLLTTPLAAFAQEGAPHILLYSFSGGLVGGFLGALLACWLCRRFGSKNDSDSNRK